MASFSTRRWYMVEMLRIKKEGIHQSDVAKSQDIQSSCIFKQAEEKLI